MGEQMVFPETFDEFAEQYKLVDTKQVYTNGTELIPVFRVRQWLMRPAPLAHNIKPATAEIERLKEIIEYKDICIEACKNIKSEAAKAEVERLKNAYKQCAWERDIFAEDMTQEIKKDCSFLMLDIKTIKTEAYKEFAERLKEKKSVYNADDFYWIKYIPERAVDNLLKELVGENDAR